jgi:hypothetical protein
MLAMSSAKTELALPGNDRRKSWNSVSFEKVSFTFTVQPYIPNRPRRATKLYTWSRFMQGSAAQPEHIPLAVRATTPVLHTTGDSSVYDSEDIDSWCKSGFGQAAPSSPEPLIFNIHLEGQKYVKLLSYSTFARWESVEMLLEGFEDEGAVIQQLWDVREDMPIWSGDWEARVCPGLEVDVICSRPGILDDESDSSSDWEEDDEEEEEEREVYGRDAVHAHGKRWWFGRWRMKVEQESMGNRGAVRQLSRRRVLCGTLAMATFLCIVFALCTF